MVIDVQLDKWILGETTRLQHQVLTSYDDYAFNRGLVAIQEFLPKLSTVYMEAVKDDLYCASEDDAYRRGAVATLSKVFDTMLRLVAPVVPHLAEELYEHCSSSVSASGSGTASETSEQAMSNKASVFLRPYEKLEYPSVDGLGPLFDLRGQLRDMDVTFEPATDAGALLTTGRE